MSVSSEKRYDGVGGKGDIMSPSILKRLELRGINRGCLGMRGGRKPFFRRLALGVFPEWALISAEVYIVVALLFYFCSVGGHLSSEPSAWGAFGAYFGGVVAPAISFLSVIALVTSIRLQRNALEMQDWQIQEQQNQLASQNEEIKRQQEEFRLQRFDSVFFGLWTVHNELVSSLGNDRMGRNGLQELEFRVQQDLGRGGFPADLRPFAESLLSLFEHIETQRLESEKARYLRIVVGRMTPGQGKILRSYGNSLDGDRRLFVERLLTSVDRQ